MSTTADSMAAIVSNQMRRMVEDMRRDLERTSVLYERLDRSGRWIIFGKEFASPFHVWENLPEDYVMPEGL